MLPGKSFSPLELLPHLRRWKWLVMPWPFVGLAAAFAISLLLPNLYRSQTLILVVPQRVPENFVKPTVTAGIGDRLRTIGQEILSRTRLEKLVQDFDLYPELRERLPLEDVIEKVRKHVEIEIAKSDSFTVSFTHGDPRTAQKVTERLATLFIEDNLKDRAAQAEGTSQFLEAQLDDARRRLEQQEKRLEEFRVQNAYELPTQLPGNLQTLQNMQLQIQQLVDGLNRDRDRQLVIDRMLADSMAATNRIVALPAIAGETASLPIELQLDAARRELRAMELRLTSEHPDIQRMVRNVAELSAKVAQAKVDGPSTDEPPAAGITPSDSTESSRLKDEQVTLARRIEQATASVEELRSKVAVYQARIEAAPRHESEMTALTRDYGIVVASYQDLLRKKEDSRIATNLERQQIGEQFRIIDPASVPEVPSSPNRPLILGGGAVGGLAIGFGLVVIIFLADSTFRTEADVTAALGLPALALVPAVPAAADGRAGRRLGGRNRGESASGRGSRLARMNPLSSWRQRQRN